MVEKRDAETLRRSPQARDDRCVTLDRPRIFVRLIVYADETGSLGQGHTLEDLPKVGGGHTGEWNFSRAHDLSLPVYGYNQQTLAVPGRVILPHEPPDARSASGLTHHSLPLLLRLQFVLIRWRWPTSWLSDPLSPPH